MANRRNLIGKAAVLMMGVDNVPEPIIDINNYLTIVALEDGLTAKLSTNACEYCIDGDGNWKTLTAATNTETINTGQTLSFRGNLTPASGSGIGTFTISKNCNLEGNCMSMLFGDDAANNFSLSGKNDAFRNLFRSCTRIKSVSSGFLPNTTLADDCYSYMFNGCTSLTQAPALPATILNRNCYYMMFQNCTSLTQAPELPAMTLADSCYASMFRNCTSLTQAPALPAMTLTRYCYEYMFYGCKNLTQAPELPATTLVHRCYFYMFYGTNALPDCSNINFSSSSVVSSGGLQGLFSSTKVTDADLERILPKNSNGKYCLPATTLASSCYYQMFYGCKNLTQAPELPAMTLADSCYDDMFYGTNALPDCSNINFSSSSVVSSGGLKGLFAGTKVTDADLERILPKNSNGKYCLPVMTLKNYCYYRMFENCTSLTTAPELPATTLIQSCYSSMFRNCTSLTTAPELPATTLTTTCYYRMFYGCSKLKYIKAMFTTTPSSSYTEYWVYGVASTGTFIKNKNATWNVTGKNGIPEGWTVQTA